ncbi:MAG: capsular biosynthesis protein [Acidobacteriota bacterium]|nr:capsular biosynthesis protein [Acidobacteriota bacterium]MDH3786909.1 capsular biosynthesis protein [Acidobacteriota bacterium]
MIDLHTHILPGIDDGVKTEDDAVEFARVAYDDGTRTIVATPHCKEGFFFNQREAILEGVSSLRQRLEREGIDMTLLPGAEVHLCPDIPERVKDGRAPTLADNGVTVLLELSLSQYPVDLENVIFQLQLAGLVILLAHPERIRFFQDDISRYESVVRLGAWGQITSGSIEGRFGSTAQSFSEKLLSRGLVHVIASDGHNTRGRPPCMAESVALAARWTGEERARAMAFDAPQQLLEGRSPDLPPMPLTPQRRSFFDLLFRRGS